MATPHEKKPNRRGTIRRPARRTSKIHIHRGALGLGPNVAVALLDISESGVRALLKTEVAAGQELELNLQGLGHRRPLKMPGQVAWCIKTADGNWCVGIQFLKTLPYRELQQIV